MENFLDLLLMLLFFVALLSIFDGLDPYFFRRKMDKTRSMRKNGCKSVYFPPKAAYFPL